MDFWHTYFLVVPYASILIFFLIYQRDNFFLKTRSSIQLLMIILLLIIVMMQLACWKGFFLEYDFLGFNLREEVNENKITPLITIIAAIAAVIGWVYTSRVQIINAIKGHSMQVLMNSRTSTIYAEKVDAAMELRKKLAKELKENGKEDSKLVLTPERYEKLEDKERSAVHYLLNFLEFAAISIRHYTLDEELIKGSLRSILNSNYHLFHPVIEHLREKDNPSIYIQLELLFMRWDKDNHEKCSKCNSWEKTQKTDNSWKTISFIAFHVVMGLATCFIWFIAVFGMSLLGKIIQPKIKNTHICGSCQNP